MYIHDIIRNVFGVFLYLFGFYYEKTKTRGEVKVQNGQFNLKPRH